MPTYNSFKGIWTPAKEETYVDYSRSKFNSNKGRKSFMHKGPDRAATERLKEAGEEFFGEDVERNPDNIMRARQLNMTVQEFLKLNEPPTKKQEEVEAAKENLVIDHSDPEPKPGVSPQGGGVTKKGSFAGEGEMPA